jgi:chromosome segregation ATPase
MKSHSFRSLRLTHAIAVLGCSLGVNLAPMLQAAPETPATQAEKPKISAEDMQRLQELKRQVAADMQKIEADKQALETFEKSLSAEQLKVEANQIKLKKLRAQLAADQAKWESNMGKLNAQQSKMDAARQ